MITIETHLEVLELVQQFKDGSLGQKSFLRGLDKIYIEALKITEEEFKILLIKTRADRLAEARRMI